MTAKKGIGAVTRARNARHVNSKPVAIRMAPRSPRKPVDKISGIVATNGRRKSLPERPLWRLFGIHRL